MVTTKDTKQEWKRRIMIDLWEQALQLTNVEYDSCAVRTHSDKPANNTPLIMMAKSQFKIVNDLEYKSMLSQLINAGGGLCLVDNQRSNAFMHACTSNNFIFFII